MLQLQQLDRPLDVGEPAEAELRVRAAVGAAGQPFRVDAGLDPPDLGDGRRGRGLRRGSASGRPSRRTARPGRGRPPPGGPAAGPAPPTPATSARSTRGRTPACAPAARCGPRGAGRRRRPAPGPGSAEPSAAPHGLGHRGRVAHGVAARRRPRRARRRTARRRRCRSPARPRRAGPCRSPRTARAARGRRSSSDRCTDSSVACSTATHTERQRGAHLLACDSTPSRSAHATRSISWRRSERAVAAAPSGSGWRATVRSSEAATSAGSRCSSSACPAVGAASSRSTSGARTSRSGDQRRGAEQLHEPLRDQPLVAQQPQVPGGVGERLGHPPVGQQAAVGVGAARRARRAAPAAASAGSPRARDTPPVSAAQVPQRALRRRPAQRRRAGPRPPPRTAVRSSADSRDTAVSSGR